MTMKHNFPRILTAALAGCLVASVHAQQDASPGAIRPNDARITINPVTGRPPGDAAQPETRFDLNFKGGTPKQFIEAIKAQSGLKVNVIIPNEEANAQLPAIEVFGVTVPRLFQALTMASTKTTNIVTGKIFQGPGIPPQAQYQTRQVGQGFRTSDNPPTQDSIWHFYVERPTHPPDIALNDSVTVHVFQLAELLAGHSIDEITTAIKTTWQMLDAPSTPELKYHADTGLLIAKGTTEQLSIVTEVLDQLRIKNDQTAGSNPRVPGQPPSQP